MEAHLEAKRLCQGLWTQRSNVERAARTLAYARAQVASLQAQCNAIAAAKSRAMAKKQKFKRAMESQADAAGLPSV